MSKKPRKQKPAATKGIVKNGSVSSSRRKARKETPAKRKQDVEGQNPRGVARGPAPTSARVASAVKRSMALVRSRRPRGTMAEAGAEMVTSGVANNALTALRFTTFRSGHVEPTELLETLEASVDRVHGGDLRPTKALLLAQATTLNAIFNHLAMLAAQTDHLDKFDRYLRLGLKAQGQSRVTLEAMAGLRPPCLVAQQTNIAHGPQQVNNEVAVDRRDPDQSQCGDAPDGPAGKRRNS
jgi:hypothetical protein